MRFEINLASQPYQDVQKFLTRWGVAVGVLALLTIGLAHYATRAVLNWRITRKQVSSFEQQIAKQEQRKSDVEAFLNRPENSQTRDRSRFLNSLIARKAFSWTEVFTDLEGIMPAHVKVTAIRPNVNEQDQLAVHLRVSSPTREPAIELVNRIERSPHFSQAEILSENLVKVETGHNQEAESWDFDIRAIYIPGFARPHLEAARMDSGEPPATKPDSAKAHGPAAGTQHPAAKLKPGLVKAAAPRKETQHAGH